MVKQVGRNIKGKTKRFFYCTFRPKKTQELISKRRGECLQCGKCCEILFRCPYLWTNGKEKKCLIYHIGRPKQCKMFPIFPEDLFSVDNKCGYNFQTLP